MATKKALIIGTSVVAVIAIVGSIAIDYPPGGGEAGTIGGVQQAARYRGRPMTPEDVNISNPEIATLFQNQEIVTLVKSEAFREAMSNEAFRSLQSNEAYRELMSSDAYRFENGQKMAGPGCTFRPPSCENMKSQRIPTLPGLTHRVVAVDEEMGIVWLRMDFGPGSVPGGQANTMFSTFEAFKVYGGKIHAAEAILEVEPVGTPSGWEVPRTN